MFTLNYINVFSSRSAAFPIGSVAVRHHFLGQSFPTTNNEGGMLLLVSLAITHTMPIVIFHDTQQAIFDGGNYWFAPTIHLTAGLPFIETKEAFDVGRAFYFTGDGTNNGIAFANQDSSGGRFPAGRLQFFLACEPLRDVVTQSAFLWRRLALES